MVTTKTNRFAPGLPMLFWILAFPMICFGQVRLDNLQVEYQTTPLGMDILAPRFSWQMAEALGKRGQYQTAYQIKVTDEHNKPVWDSGKVQSDVSLGIGYQGEKLQPTTRYSLEVSAWDQDQKKAVTTSWFETGLLNPDPAMSVWDGAKWIGGTDEDVVLHSHYLSVYKMEYTLQLDQASKSTRAAFVFGGNDTRLMDRNKNIQGVEVGKDQSYIAFELDLRDMEKNKDGQAKFHVYRVGYAPEDTSEKPFKSFNVPIALLNQQNKYDKQTFFVECNFGVFDVYLGTPKKEHKIVFTDTPSPSSFANNGLNLNPVGNGNNYISFPMVADIGFKMEPSQKAIFSDVKIKNYRTPSNVLFQENVTTNTYDGIFKNFQSSGVLSVKEGSYQLNGNKSGVVILADPSKNAAPMLRTEFATQGKKIQKARLYITSRGIYEAYLNGKRIGQDYFNPGLTQYNKTHMYQTYDVTEMLQENGKNAFGVWLGEGWWSGNITYSGENWNYFGDRQSLLSKLVITYDDKTEQIITSNDREWKIFTEGPIRYGSFFQGEVYDARKEHFIENWSSVGFDGAQWKNAVEVPLMGNSVMGSYLNAQGRPVEMDYGQQQIIGQMGGNAKVVMELTAQSMEEVRPGVYVYDMGQNMVGVPKISLPNGKSGDTITLRYAEVKYPDLPEYGENVGMVMLENIRAALTQDQYIRKGGNETIQPRFTFHGYRFLEITGIDKPLPLADVKGLVISSIDQLSSSYSTSNDLVNKLWENITWSFRGNFLSIPTDTPARNERMGWSGDINVFSKAATYLGNVEPFLNRHLLAMRNIQFDNGRFTDVAPVGGGFGGTLWGSAGMVIPWELYQQYGDLAVLQEHYGAMKKYMAFLASKENDKGILDEGPLGDWLSPENAKNDNTALWNAYQVYDLDILAKTASILGKEQEAQDFRKQYEQRKSFFNSTYVDAESHKTLHTGHEGVNFGPPIPEDQKPKPGDEVDSQASYAIPLALNVFDENHKPFAKQYLADAVARKNTDDSGVLRPEYALMTGFIGTASLNEALSQNGLDAHAYRLLQQTSYPSWLYSVVNGATTIWERLNSYTVEDGFGGNNSMNSFNHYSFGAVAAWMYNYSLGIQRDPESPGFKHFILKPTPDPDGTMSWAKGFYDSMYGRIVSEWELKNDHWIFTTEIPANTTATVYLKANSQNDITVSDKKGNQVKDLTILPKKDGYMVLELKSGSYVFKINK